MMSSTRAKVEERPAISSFDVADFLKTPEDYAGYLDAWFEDAPDDSAGLVKALGDIARAKGMSKVAADAGLSRESLYRALSGRGNPSFATVLKVLTALGIRLRAEHVDVGPRSNTPTDASA